MDKETRVDETKSARGVEGESVRQKVADMMDYAEPFLDKFPRSEKGYAGLATKIRMCMNAIAEREMDTHKCYYPKSVLKELNELDKQVQYGKFYIQRAYKKKILDLKRFTIMSDYLLQIGKMTGSWIGKIKQSSNIKE